MKYSNTLIKDFSDLYEEERKGKNDLIITFSLVENALKALDDAELIVRSEGDYHQTKLDFIRLGIKGNKVFFRISSRSEVSEELQQDLEQKTRFIKEGELKVKNIFCADYSMHIYPG